MWARRLIVGASLAVASVAMVPGIASADTGTSCTSAGSVTEPSNCVTTPTVNDGNDGAVQAPVVAVTKTATPPPKATATTSSLPFTGADVAELALIGTGAVLAGGVLTRRRRRTVA
jgi:LPXTG-motif cell wall-anchored protein